MDKKLKTKKSVNVALTIVFVIIFAALATLALVAIFMHNQHKTNAFATAINKIWKNDTIWQVIMPAFYALAFYTLTLGIIVGKKYKLIENNNKNLKRQKASLIAFVIIFSIIFLVVGLFLVLTKVLKNNAGMTKLLTNMKLTGFEQWLWMSGIVTLALVGLLIITLIIAVPTLKYRNNSTVNIKINNDGTYATATLDFVAPKSESENGNFYAADLKAINLKLVEDSDNYTSGKSTPPSNTTFQNMQILVNDINTFISKMPLPKYSLLVEYIKKALEEYTIKPNENLTDEILIRKENNLELNYKRARFVKLLLETKDYGLQLASTTNMQIMGSQLLNYVNSKYEIVNNVTSLTEIKKMINEVLEKHLFVKLNELRFEAIDIMQKNPNNANVANAIKQVLEPTDAALENKDIALMKANLVRLAKLIQNIKDSKIAKL